MKKVQFLLTCLLLVAAVSFAQNESIFTQDRSVFFEGTAPEAEQLEFFLENFRLEAESAGYVTADDRDDAGYTFKFQVKPNIIEYEDGTTEAAPPDEPQFVIEIIFIRNNDGTEVVSFDFPFTTLEEMYEYTQFLFLRAAVNIPLDVLPELEAPEGDINREWLNRWLFLRMSIDLPITFYRLKDVSWLYHEKDKIVALPGVTLGAEVHFLDFMSAGLYFQAAWEHLNDSDFISMTAGAQIKFPFKFLKNIVLEPYAAAAFPTIPRMLQADILSKDEIFYIYPKYGIGGGLEVNIKAGKRGAFFLDTNYMYYGDTVMDDLVKYRRYVIGIAIGYKVGLFNRVKDKVSEIEEQEYWFEERELPDEVFQIDDADTDPEPEIDEYFLFEE